MIDAFHVKAELSRKVQNARIRVMNANYFKKEAGVLKDHEKVSNIERFANKQLIALAITRNI